jgi:hypothetical protein
MQKKSFIVSFHLFEILQNRLIHRDRKQISSSEEYGSREWEVMV